MKIKHFPITYYRFSTIHKFWLWVVIAALIVININLIAKYGDSNLNNISVIFGLAVLFLLWNKRQNIQLNSDRVFQIIGTILILCVLVKSIFIPQGEALFQIMPFLSGTGLALITSGRWGLKQYSRELMLLFALAIPFEAIFSHLLDLATLTAQYASLILYYLGFKVSQAGNNVILSTGVVEVEHACAGFKVVEQMLRIAILHNVMFAGSWLRNIFLTIMAVFLGFTVNAIRVTVLVIFVAKNQPQLFEFFHGVGGHIFPLIATLIFALLCYILLKTSRSKSAKY